MSNTTNLILPLLAAAQAQKHVTVNESLLKLDALLMCAPKSDSTTAEPASPADGDVYILPAGKTGTHWGPAANGALAHYRDGVWQFYAPREGFLAFVKDTDTIKFYDGTAWQTFSAVVPGATQMACNGRLTLVSGAPVMTGDQTAKTTVYLTPMNGAQIALYDGSAWALLPLAEKSIKLTDTQTGTTTNGSTAVTGLADTSQLIVGMKVSGTGIAGGSTIAAIPSSSLITLSANATASGSASLTFKAPADTNLDLFAFNDAGAPKLEMVAWTNATTRATALALQDGVWVKSGAATRRFLGMVRTTAVDGQTEFTPTPAPAAGGSHPKLYLWNCCNQVPVSAICRDSNTTYTYTTRTWRKAANSDNWRISFVLGLAGGSLAALRQVFAGNDTGTHVWTSIGYDSVSAPAGGAAGGVFYCTGTSYSFATATLAMALADVGHHYVSALEQSTAVGTTTWSSQFGSNEAYTALLAQLMM